MNGRRHVALVIEDDALEMAEIVEFLDTIGIGAIKAATREEAEECIRRGGYCFVLLDLELPLTPKTKTIEVGIALLAFIRRIYPARNVQDRYCLPVVVTSQNAKDRDRALKLTGKGAESIIIDKPLSSNQPTVTDKIEEILRLSDRESHEKCDAIDIEARRPRARPGGESVAQPDPCRLDILGTRERKRTLIALGGRRVPLKRQTFIMTLHLVLARLRGPGIWVAVQKIDRKVGRGYKGFSRLMEDVRTSLPDGVEFFYDNNLNGDYQLHEKIKLGPIAVDVLDKHSEVAIQDLSKEIRVLLERPNPAPPRRT